MKNLNVTKIMKKNKITFFRFIYIAIFAMVCFASVSCGGNDDNDAEDVSVRQQLVGVWKTFLLSSNWKVIELDSNGYVHYGMHTNSDGEIFYSSFESTQRVARWTFNEKDQTISMYTDDGYYAYTLRVSMGGDGKSWAGYDISECKTYSFVKLDASKIVSQ